MEVWVEKYRPKKLDDVLGQEEVIKGLKSYIISKNMPHLMFSGPPGTGKTSAVLCFVRELFGDEWHQNFMELNASVSKNTPVLVRINGIIERTSFEKLDKLYFRGNEEIKTISNLEVLTVDKELKIIWKKVSNIIRHKVDKILRIHFEGGIIDITGNHSIILFGENGELINKSAKDLKEGDHLISFITKLACEDKKLALINEELAWFYGAYTAEGCLGNNDIIFVWNIDEKGYINRTEKIAKKYGYGVSNVLGKSGFNRDNLSSLQIIVMNVTLARFMRNNFYERFSIEHTAHTKRIPVFMYNTNLKNRLFYLKGEYDGDGTGDWEGYFRITSVSNDLLKDIAWFGRISGIPTSVFPNDNIVHLSHNIENNPMDIIPCNMFINLLDAIPNNNKYFGNWKYDFRHNLYGKKNDLISKKNLKKTIEKCRKYLDQPALDSFFDINLDNILKENIWKIHRLIDSDLYSTPIRKIEIIDYKDYVYDVSVPGNEMFFAGDVPILLHNSDERGIGTVREKIKGFAMSSPIGDEEFKVIFLDESDALTDEAQSALRRTMEKYTNVCRFILSVNYSSKIIDPIQSRCAVYKFKPVPDSAVMESINFIAKAEGLEISTRAYQAISYITQGDLRRTINALQAAAMVDKKIDADIIYKTSSMARPEDIEDLILLSIQGDFARAHTKLNYLLHDEGLAGTDITSQVYKHMFKINIPDKLKLELIDYIGEIDFRISEGSNEDVQLGALVSKFALYGINKK